MLVKVHKAYRTVVAICDTELLGRNFEEGNAILYLRENFFNGEDKQEGEVIEIMSDMIKEDATFMIAGKNSIDCALKSGIISEEGIKKVQGVPFALVLL